MQGKVAVITGGNTGIGYATAKALAMLGAHVIIACRSEERAVAAIHRMKQEVSADRPEQPGILVEYMQLDLASLQSVKRFTTTLTERNQPLHILINNAGISWVHYGLTEDGFEQHYQVGYTYIPLPHSAVFCRVYTPVASLQCNPSHSHPYVHCLTSHVLHRNVPCTYTASVSYWLI
jgi:NAD(P)-dependent dehydrogenase (short-subunit alcohol dehydrogenase family)